MPTELKRDETQSKVEATPLRYLGIEDLSLNVIVENFQEGFLKKNSPQELKEEIKKLEHPLEGTVEQLIEPTEKILGKRFGEAKEFRIFSSEDKINRYEEDPTTREGLTVSFSPGRINYSFYFSPSSFKDRNIGDETTEWELVVNRDGDVLSFKHSRKRTNSYKTFGPEDEYLKDSLQLTYGENGPELELVVNVNSPQDPTDEREEEMFVTKKLSFGELPYGELPYGD